MPVINFASLFNSSCIPEDKQPDPETGCGPFCAKERISAMATFEECRQAYFLKKQNQILQSQQSSKETIAELKAANDEFRNLLEKQNQQIENQIQELKEQSQLNDSISTSLKYVKFLNISLSLIILLLAVLLAAKIIKKNKWKK